MASAVLVFKSSLEQYVLIIGTYTFLLGSPMFGRSTFVQTSPSLVIIV